MDQELSELKRRVEADPGDVEAVRRYEAALQRVGEVDALAARYVFEFLCPYEFDELEPGEWSTQRRCPKCDRDVHFVRSEAELAERVEAGECIAIEVRELGPLIDGWIEDPSRDSAADPARPCVVTGRDPKMMARGKVAPRRLPKARPKPALSEAIEQVRARLR